MADLIKHYGLALILANVLIQQLGLPIPAAPTLIVAGALAGAGSSSALAIFGVACAACCISDTAWYTTGRLYGRRVMKLLCRISLSPDSCVRQSESLFQRWGRFALVLAKFVPGLSTITLTLAGAMRLSWWSFAILDGLGSALWAGVAIGSGMLLHDEIAHLIVRLQGQETTALAVIGLLIAGYILIKWWQRRRFYAEVKHQSMRN